MGWLVCMAEAEAAKEGGRPHRNLPRIFGQVMEGRTMSMSAVLGFVKPVELVKRRYPATSCLESSQAEMRIRKND